ncbi:hypothetical protein [Salinibius halmophilus]|uniref:hypothetical protein n=1 Tax=Salinibius halmophilus TaxID=1853216 RepID=UPI000E675A7F|nr:hypothetical protein [Salinibius halmophilus]
MANIRLHTAGQGDSGTDYRIHYYLTGYNEKHELKTYASEILGNTGISKNKQSALSNLNTDIVTPTKLKVSCSHSDCYRPAFARVEINNKAFLFANYGNEAAESDYGGRSVELNVLQSEMPVFNLDELKRIKPVIPDSHQPMGNSAWVLVQDKLLEDKGNAVLRHMRIHARYEFLAGSNGLTKSTGFTFNQSVAKGVEKSTTVTKTVTESIGLANEFVSLSHEVSNETSHTISLSEYSTESSTLNYTPTVDNARYGVWQLVYQIDFSSIVDFWGKTASLTMRSKTLEPAFFEPSAEEATIS